MRYLLALLLALPALAGDWTVTLTVPDTFADGTPLPIEQVRAANVYCGGATRTYTMLRSATTPLPGTRDYEVVLPVTSRLFCAGTVVVGDVTDPTLLTESDFSVEFVIPARAPAAPLFRNVRQSQPPMICTTSTTCTVSRGSGG